MLIEKETEKMTIVIVIETTIISEEIIIPMSLTNQKDNTILYVAGGLGLLGILAIVIMSNKK